MSRVFLSYSHDSEPHRQRVLQLALRLLEVGHDVILDRFTPEPDPNWPQWMARELLAADVVLCVCTPTYRARFEGTASPGGLGVAWEGHLITTELYGRKGKPGRFVPVLAGDADAVPVTLRGQPALSMDDVEGVVAALGGTVGPARQPPEVHAGWTEAMTVGAMVGPIWRPLRQPKGDEGYVPTQLLRAEHAVVPFMGRQELLDDLDRWCEGGGARVRLVYGPGGAGKTRLALEVAARRCREGWRAGPLAVWRDAHAPLEYLDALFRDRIPLFLIVDYAETRSEVLVPLLQRLGAAGDVTARVVLVARARGDWWDRAMAEVPELDRMSFGWPEIRVETVEGGAGHAERAASAFAEWAGRAVPRSVRDHGRTALDRQVEALVAVLGGGPLGGMAQLLRHEDRFLLEAGRPAGLTHAVGRLLPRAMALFTLAGGAAPDEAREWLRGVTGLADLRDAEGLAVVELLGDLYPRDTGGIDGMRPDRVGEALAAREDRDGVLAEAAVDRGRGKVALTVLTRLGTTGEGDPLRRLIEARRGVLVRETIEVAQEVGDPVGTVMAACLRGRPDLELAAALDRGLPAKSVALLELGVVAKRQIIESAAGTVERANQLDELSAYLFALGEWGEALRVQIEAVADYREMAFTRPDAPPVGLAKALSNLSARFGRLGMVDDALSAIREAVGLDREIAKRGGEDVPPADPEPGQADSDPGLLSRYNLSVSLNTLAIGLEQLGRHEEALAAVDEAISIDQRFSVVAPGAFLPGYQASLNTRSTCLVSLGRFEEAQETMESAVAVARNLADEWPDAHLPDLAVSLNNLSHCLLATGRTQEGLAAVEEGVAIYRRLAAARPQAFAIGLGTALGNMSKALSSSGRLEEAALTTAEAVALHRVLSAASPHGFLPGLGSSLSDLVRILSALGRLDDALIALNEEVIVDRELVAARPDVFLGNLGASLNNLANLLRRLDRDEEALGPMEEAVGTFRQLATSNPGRFLPDLALTLSNQFGTLLVCGLLEQALSAIEEAVEIYVGLAAVRPQEFLPKVGTLQRLWAETLFEVARDFRGAARVARLAILTLRPLVTGSASDLGDQLNTARRTYLFACVRSGLPPERALFD